MPSTKLKKDGTPKSSGGANRGQGRKPADGIPNKEQHKALIDPELYEYAKKLGKGVLSAGITRALLHAKDSGLS